MCPLNHRPPGALPPFRAFALTARCGLAALPGVSLTSFACPGLQANPPSSGLGWPSAILRSAELYLTAISPNSGEARRKGGGDTGEKIAHCAQNVNFAANNVKRLSAANRSQTACPGTKSACFHHTMGDRNYCKRYRNSCRPYSIFPIA